MRGLGWVAAHVGYNGFAYTRETWHVASSVEPREKGEYLARAKTLCGRNAWVPMQFFATAPKGGTSCAACARKAGA